MLKCSTDGAELNYCLHLHDALGEVGWYFGETFAAAVHDVVVAGAAGRTHGHLRNASPGFCLSRTCGQIYGSVIYMSESEKRPAQVIFKAGLLLVDLKRNSKCTVYQLSSVKYNRDF